MKLDIHVIERNVSSDTEDNFEKCELQYKKIHFSS